MERSKAVAGGSRLPERRPEPHRVAAATWGIRAVSLLRKMALRQTPTAGSLMPTDISVDGISTSSAVWGGATVITPSEDSIGNIQVFTNAYDAENGRFTGAVTEITSKSGTNDLHGSFFVQITRPGLNAYQRWNGPQSVQAFDPATGRKLTPAERGLLRDEDRYNQLGGSIGGPIWKNRVFAFFAYEGQSQSIPATSTEWFPTAAFADLAPGNSISNTYLHFKGANVAGTVIGSVTCANAGLVEGVNCNTIAGQGLNIGSPLTTGLSKQDLTYVNASNPGVGGGLSNVADITQYTHQQPHHEQFQTIQRAARCKHNQQGSRCISRSTGCLPASRKLNGGLGYQQSSSRSDQRCFLGHLESHFFSRLS